MNNNEDCANRFMGDDKEGLREIACDFRGGPPSDGDYVLLQHRDRGSNILNITL